MRMKAANGPLTVHAISGGYVVLLGIDLDEAARPGVLGFAIERTDHTRGDRRDWLLGFKSFEGTGLEPGALVSTHEHPIQGFLWSDFTARVGSRYSYRVVAMRGEPGDLVEGESVSVQIAMEREDSGKHAVYFNRGVAGSQAYARKFGNRQPDEVPDRAAWRWLSRGLFRNLLDFIHQASGPRFSLRAAVYEFNQGAVLKAFADARAAGADVRIVYDARQVINEENPSSSKLEPAKSNLEAIEEAGLADVVIPRRANPRDISHNKFIVLLEDGRPVQVWTGSTNMTQGGIFGHSNVGHAVRDPQVAASYLQYWEKLAEDPEANRVSAQDQIRPFNDEHFPVPDGLPGEESITTIFSPRRTLQALEWYAERMDAAGTAVFLTAAFGVNDKFEEILSQDKEYLRYLLLETEDEDMALLRTDSDVRIAVGSVLEENEFERWLKERTTNLNKHVKYIHTKYMLIDPLGDDPLVITGSANFSDASTRRNDENMLVVRGDKQVADLYLVEFMRLFNHFYFRSVANRNAGAGNRRASPFLTPDDSWSQPYYEPGSVKQKERVYFAGR